MNITITPGLLSGEILPPASKSQAHRMIIAAALAEGESIISHVNVSQDILATLRCMEVLGAEACWLDETTLKVTGHSRPAAFREMDCGESGSTLRFLIPIALAVAGKGSFCGHGRLMERPQEPYFALFRERGIRYARSGARLEVEGKLTPGIYQLPGNVSSQFITGLLYALTLLDGDSEIRLTTDLESSGYVDMTLDALRQFGVRVTETAWGYLVPGNQKYTPFHGDVEADYSQSGFFYAMAGMGSRLNILGMNPHSAQGDRAVVTHMEALNAPGTVTIDVKACPDLVPPLAARAALRPGEATHIVGAGRLRIKESDRLNSVRTVLNAMGAEVQEHPDALTIHGKEALAGGVTVDSFNDHRIAMMAAVAATRCEKPVTITGAQCVEKSYPAFWKDYAMLGGIIREEQS